MRGEVAATVLMPTHDHGPLVQLSALSALRQTAGDLELFIVGDGAPDETRRIVEDLRRQDERVRFFDNPKGPRHGEIHRHAALKHAQGRYVMYLSDDDLWLPDHVETMLGVLERADFATAAGFVGRMHDRVSRPKFRNFGSPTMREALLAGRTGFGISWVAHTMSAYRALPFGWRTTPEGGPTDRYMWQQFFADPGLRVATAFRPTVLSLGSPSRPGMTIAERLEEMRGWWDRIEDPVLRGELYAEACAESLRRNNWRLEKQRAAEWRSPRRRFRAVATRLASSLGHRR